MLDQKLIYTITRVYIGYIGMFITKRAPNIAGYSRFCYVSLRQSTIHHHVTQETDGEGFTSGKSSMVYDEH